VPYWKLHYHLVWATHERLPLITSQVEPPMYQATVGKAQELGATVHAIVGTTDHLHLAVSIPPKVSLAAFIGQVKGAASYYVNHQSNAEGIFDWQRGYGALSVGPQGLPLVIEYVRNQKEHHRQGDLIAAMERVEEVPGAKAPGNMVQGR